MQFGSKKKKKTIWRAEVLSAKRFTAANLMCYTIRMAS
jgi:hypothetical protein